MRVLQDLVLLSLLLLSISKVYSQEDKKTKELFNSGGYISDGYALDRNQVRFNQSSDFVFHYIPGGDRLTCITSKQVRDYNRHYNCILSNLCLPYFAGIKIPFMLTLVLKQDL